jgi:hypothetical protein
VISEESKEEPSKVFLFLRFENISLINELATPIQPQRIFEEMEQPDSRQEWLEVSY